MDESWANEEDLGVFTLLRGVPGLWGGIASRFKLRGNLPDAVFYKFWFVTLLELVRAIASDLDVTDISPTSNFPIVP